LALGFGALAATTLITAGTELGWIPASQRHEAAVLVIAFGPPLQLIASYFGFLARDAVAATGLGIQSAAWLCIGLSLLVSEPGDHSHALALLLFSAGVGMLSSAAVAVRTKLLVGLVMGLTSLRFILTGVFEWGAGTGWGNGAGWTGVVLCGLALYAAVSLELEDVSQRTILPTLRRGAGKRVLHQPLDEQVQDVATEAGVRSQL
jgi:hypothetical protein